MNIQEVRDEKLNTTLKKLFLALTATSAQSRIRADVLSVGEVETMREHLYSSLPDSDSEEDVQEFRLQFDSNGLPNLQFLAKHRGVGPARIILDMSVEIGLLSETDYRRYLRQVESDSVVRESVLLHYTDGSLYRNGKLTGSVQQRKPASRMETVLQMFQDQNWPTTISAPEAWDNEKVKNVCSQLRSRFEGHVSFHESNGGLAIGYCLVTPAQK